MTEPKRVRKAKPERSIVPLKDETALENTATSTLYEQVRAILDEARMRAARSVNSEMVRAYWQIGAAIVEQEQAGKDRAEYGARLLESLAVRLKADNLKGFSVRNLYWMREFYEKFPILHAVRAELSWTHYRLLLKFRQRQRTQSVSGGLSPSFR